MLRLLLALLLVAGCAGGTPSAPPPSSSGAFPVTLTHALGTTTIPAEPKRIVALSYEEDALALVGLKVVGRAGNLYDAAGEPYPWQVGTVDLSGADSDAFTANGDINFERLAAMRPDLILATNRYDLSSTYDWLSAIAPTVGYEIDWGRSTWQETATQIGRAVGRSEEMAGAVASLETYLAGFARDLPGLEGKTFAGVYHYEPGGFAANTDPNGHATRLLVGLGMRPDPDFVASVVDRSLAAENIGLLDADFLKVSFASPDLEQALLANPLFARLPVVMDGRFYATDNFGAMASNNPTMLNIPWQLDQERPVLEKVAAG